MTENYNGWKNRETWVVALWLNNEQDLYNVCRAIVKVNDRFKARDMIEDMVRRQSPITCGMYADLINHALWQVDWDAIAKSFMED